MYRRSSLIALSRALKSYSLATRTFTSSIPSLLNDELHRRNAYQPLLYRIRDLKKEWYINPVVKDHIRTSLSALELEDRNLELLDTDMSICFLGTGSGKATTLRGNSSVALRLHDETFLIDAGEGTQTQLMVSKIRPSDIKRIFITHMHGDHILGLPGLLLTLHNVARQAAQPRKLVIKIYGPVGLYNYISVALSLSASEIGNLSVEVYELVGAQRYRHPGAHRRYYEFRHRGLSHFTIPQNEDGTWTIDVATEVDTPEDAVKFHSRPQGVYIQACEVYHVPKMQCLGYVVSESKKKPRKIDPKKALAAGLSPGQKYKIIKCGFPVMNDDGSREVQPDEVLIDEEQKSRKAAFLGDCCGIPPQMVNLCHGADVVVHEATLLSDEPRRRDGFGGHTTSANAGRFANFIKADLLLLNHISPSNSVGIGRLERLVKEAQDEITGHTQVQLSYDFMEVVVPRNGFPHRSRT